MLVQAGAGNKGTCVQGEGLPSDMLVSSRGTLHPCSVFPLLDDSCPVDALCIPREESVQSR